MIIERYRQGGLAQGYYGDSIVNSVADTLVAVIGFVVAWRFPVWATLLAAVALEVVLGYAIRDNLTLNVLQLLYPNETLTRWQSGQ